VIIKTYSTVPFDLVLSDLQKDEVLRSCKTWLSGYLLYNHRVARLEYFFPKGKAACFEFVFIILIPTSLKIHPQQYPSPSPSTPRPRLGAPSPHFPTLFIYHFLQISLITQQVDLVSPLFEGQSRHDKLSRASTPTNQQLGGL
jgi:hypothetical protein